MMGWGGVDASTHGFGDPANTRADNGDALRAAYEEAVRRGVPLHIPAGTYEVELRKGRLEEANALAINAYWGGSAWIYGEAAIIGAGAAVTTIQFYYPSSGPQPSGDDCYGFYMPYGAPGTARVEGLTLELAEWVGGAADPYDPANPSDGIGEPRTFGVYIRYAEALVMIDVHTTGWNTAIVSEGTWPNTASLHLERCNVSSRGVRVGWNTGRATLIDCTFSQDPDGFVMSRDPNSFWPAVYLGYLTYLHVLGGRSLGNRDLNTAYSFHSDVTGSQTPRRITIRDHKFQGTSGGAIQFTGVPNTAVLIDNCTFEGTAALCPYGVSTTYHVSNCVFDVTGQAITDAGKDGADAEVHVTNCQIMSSNDHSVVRRELTTSSKPWYFSNCTLVNTSIGRVVHVIDGVAFFHHCQLRTSPTAAGSAIEQYHGRIELHDCTIDAASGAAFFSNFYYGKILMEDPVTLARVYDGVVVRALQVSFERCLLRGPYPWVRVAPYAPVFIRGRGNSLGRLDVLQFRDHSRDSDDGGRPIPDLDPELLESDLQLRRGRARRSVVSVIGTSTDALVLDWNSDWIEVESVTPVKYVFMASDYTPAYADGRANYPVGTTIRLFAVDGFWLFGGGNIDLGPFVAGMRLGAGDAVSLRYSALSRTWMVSS